MKRNIKSCCAVFIFLIYIAFPNYQNKQVHSSMSIWNSSSLQNQNNQVHSSMSIRNSSSLQSNRICAQNPFSKWTTDKFESVARRMDDWLEPENFNNILHQATTNESWKVKWNIFNSIQVLTSCKESQKVCIGGLCRDDQSKIACGLLSLDPRCVVYSIGGNNQWEFENDLLDRTPCSIHTFDCTGPKERYNAPNNSRHFFHHVCLGAEHEESPEICKGSYNIKCGPTWTLKEMQQHLGHRQIDLLKMDIEGWEWQLMESWPEMTSPESLGFYLPMQVAVELHTSSKWRRKQKYAWKVATLHHHLLKVGYAVIERDDNPYCPHCSELTMLRVRCPSSSY